tara:strand:- start:4009 stop:4968 length:960 start_codon:yes stop_codon:yes gene_type:complete
MKKKILITGAAGFIGFSLANKLLKKNYTVIGLDNLNNYYSKKLKLDRLKLLKKNKNFKFFNCDITSFNKLNSIFKKYRFDLTFNLAAQAGVRYSLKNPRSYIDSNLNGFFNFLECCKIYKVKKIFYASSSSVYGDLKKYPYNENFSGVPKNIYSLSKKFNEELAQVYSDLFGLKVIGYRFFTVYGEWGRPDMFYLKYLLYTFKNKVININNYGNHFRDFTYIGDVVDILIKMFTVKIKLNHDVFNICSNNPISLMKIVQQLNYLSGKKCKIKKTKLEKVDVIKTHGNNKKIIKLVKKTKFLELEKGLENTFKWFKNYYL